MADDSQPPSRNGPWQVHSTELSYENPWIRVETSRITHPNGAPGVYGVVRFANFATGVLPIDEDGCTWLVGQHRFAFDAYGWELPEGGGRKDVDPQDSAARELAEETGLQAANWARLGEWHLSNSVTDEIGIGYVAWGLSHGPSAPEASEELKVERVPFRTLVERCLSGEVTDAFTHLIVFAALERARRGDLPKDVARLLLGEE